MIHDRRPSRHVSLHLIQADSGRVIVNFVTIIFRVGHIYSQFYYITISDSGRGRFIDNFVTIIFKIGQIHSYICIVFIKHFNNLTNKYKKIEGSERINTKTINEKFFIIFLKKLAKIKMNFLKL